MIKPGSRNVDLRLRYVGFEIPDQFVVGYGLTRTSGIATCRLSRR